MKTFLTIICICFTWGVSAQITPSFNYQAALRDATNKPLSDPNFNIKVNIVSENGFSVYEEVHYGIASNSMGLFSIAIGSGQTTGTLNNVEWDNGRLFLKIELDLESNGNYELIGEEELRFVPLAAYALNSQPGPKGDIGPIGPQGEKGDTGLKGEKGDTGPAGTYTAGTGITISNNQIRNTGDANANDDVLKSSLFDGDVSGVYSKIRVTGLMNKRLNSRIGQPTQDDVIFYNGTEWTAGKLSSNSKTEAHANVRFNGGTHHQFTSDKRTLSVTRNDKLCQYIVNWPGHTLDVGYSTQVTANYNFRIAKTEYLNGSLIVNLFDPQQSSGICSWSDFSLSIIKLK